MRGALALWFSCTRDKVSSGYARVGMWRRRGSCFTHPYHLFIALCLSLSSRFSRFYLFIYLSEDVSQSMYGEEYIAHVYSHSRNWALKGLLSGAGVWECEARELEDAGNGSQGGGRRRGLGCNGLGCWVFLDLIYY